MGSPGERWFRAAVRWLAVTGVIGTLLCCSLARAENPDEAIARAHFQTGLSYYESDHYASAVKEFQEAWRLSRRSAILYNIARTFEKLDDPARAVVHYRRYLEAVPNPPELAQVSEAIARLVPAPRP
ncbi:MAG: tetratricopeptide repeat protein [Myxococcales bacterium]|nr:tetratricopeptide repeat protein [Myxococcales bacterium]